MRALIVLNPVAGRTKATVVRQAIDRHFKENEWQITVHETKAGEPVGDIVGHQIESGLDVVIAAGGAVINFNLIALPMSEMVGGGSYIGDWKTSDVAALVIILVEVAMGLYLMESLRITRLFPVIVPPVP